MARIFKTQDNQYIFIYMKLYSFSINFLTLYLDKNKSTIFTELIFLKLLNYDRFGRFFNY